MLAMERSGRSVAGADNHADAYAIHPSGTGVERHRGRGVSGRREGGPHGAERKVGDLEAGVRTAFTGAGGNRRQPELVG
nr:Nbc5 [Streptomyces sp.]